MIEYMQNGKNPAMVGPGGENPKNKKEPAETAKKKLADKQKIEAKKALMKRLRYLSDFHPEPLPGYKFKVYIMGTVMGFMKVTNLEEGTETIPLQEGGVNDRVHRLVSPVTAERTLILERGVALGTVANMLFNPLSAGTAITGDILITLHNRNGQIGRCFFIKHAYVKKITFEGVDSMNANPVIQHFELSYEKLETMGLPGVPDIFY